MAYNYYLLKINNTVLDNGLMVVPSYKVTEKPIEVLNYYDQTYTKHIEQATAKDLTISFTLRQLKGVQYNLAITRFSGRLLVEYYDVQTDTYKTGYFKRTSNIEGSIWRIQNGEIWYNAESIVLEKVA